MDGDKNKTATWRSKREEQTAGGGVFVTNIGDSDVTKGRFSQLEQAKGVKEWTLNRPF